MDKEAQAADDAQFESGYDDVTPTGTPAIDTAKPESNAAPAEAIAETLAKPEPVDPIVAMQAQLEKFQQGHDKLAGHIGNLTRATKDIADRLATGNAAAKNVGDAPSSSQVQAAAASPAKWEKLKGEFPEWAEATDENIDSKIAARLGAQQIDVDAVNRLVSQQLEGQTARVRQEIVSSTLEVVLENWEDEVKTPAFGKWLDVQVESVKALARSDKVGDAARMLKLYDKAKRAPVQPAASASNNAAARQKRLEAAIAPRGSGGAAASRSEMDDFESGYAS
jgi:hypothetical protein